MTKGDVCCVDSFKNIIDELFEKFCTMVKFRVNYRNGFRESKEIEKIIIMKLFSRNASFVLQLATSREEKKYNCLVVFLIK